MPRSIKEILDQADEYADAFEAADPLDPVDISTPEMELRRAAYHRAQAERELVDAVRHAKHKSMTWGEIGTALGTSGEAARQRYGKILEDA